MAARGHAGFTTHRRIAGPAWPAAEQGTKGRARASSRNPPSSIRGARAARRADDGRTQKRAHGRIIEERTRTGQGRGRTADKAGRRSRQQVVRARTVLRDQVAALAVTGLKAKILSGEGWSGTPRFMSSLLDSSGQVVVMTETVNRPTALRQRPCSRTPQQRVRRRLDAADEGTAGRQDRLSCVVAAADRQPGGRSTPVRAADVRKNWSGAVARDALPPEALQPS